ncbi:MAG: hypothetical protein KF833_14190 [Verrucomicrobiae bacterium]|nr:hypothetical protein [Verrucomicrobiae bacterium]
MSERQYAAVWGRRIRVITVLVLLLCGGVTVGIALLVNRPEERWVVWLVTALMLGIVGGTALFSIRGFEIGRDGVRIRRVLWTNRIPFEAIESAEVDPEACRGAWKTMGNDGLFAMHGWFRSRRLGSFRAFVTHPGDAVVLRGPKGIVVVSPENPRRFVNDLNRRRGRGEGRP